MNITELPLGEAFLLEIPNAAIAGAELVGVSVDDSAESILEAINRFLAPPKTGESAGSVKSDPNIDHWYDFALPLGALWGQTMIRNLAWRWALLVADGVKESKAIAIVNKDDSLAIYPLHYCYDCLENQAFPMVLPAFKMIVGNKIPAQPTGSFVNVMNGVSYILPPG